MSDIKQYDYAHPLQRRAALINVFTSAAAAGVITVDVLSNLQMLFPYLGIFGITGAVFLGAHLLGVLAGRGIFAKVRKTRILYICVEVIFILLAASYLLKEYRFGHSLDIYTGAFFGFPYLSIAVLILFPLVLGMKNNYLLRVTCGTFFDEKKGAIQFLLFLMMGFAIGMVAKFFLSQYLPLPVFAVFIILLIPVCFLIKAEYAPTPFLAQNVGLEEVEREEDRAEFRDDIFFSYLNFSCIVIYAFLAGKVIFRYYGDVPSVKVLYIALVFVGLSAGYIIAMMVRKILLLFIYAEIVYPLLFFGFFLLVHLLSPTVSIFRIFAFLAPVLVLFGMTLQYSVRAIVEKHLQMQSYRIMCFSIFVLPVPILISILLIPFTQRVFFIFFYTFVAINVIIPGIYIAQKKVSELKKGLFFLFSVSIVPLFIFAHLYFSIPFSSKPFQERVTGFNEIINLNYNADFIQKTIDVTINGKKAFHVSDQTVRNIRQATTVIAMFSDTDNDPVLFIDGTRKFYVNPIQNLFKRAVRIDYVPRQYTGYQRIPSTMGEIANIENDLVLALAENRNQYEVIADNPNLYDQQVNGFRFSVPYYRLIKKFLTGKRIFIQTMDIARCGRDMYIEAMKALPAEFPYSVLFVFGDTLVIICSDKADSLTLNEGRLQLFKAFISKDTSFSTIFFSDMQCLSHVWLIGYPVIAEKPEGKDQVFGIGMFGTSRIGAAMPDRFGLVFETTHNTGTGLFGKTDPYRQSIEQNFRNNDTILTLVKKAENSSLNKDYEGETKYLLELKKYGEYNPPLRQYATAFLSFREKSFNDVALLYEKDKQWEDAAKIYRSMLLINPNNFEANYKMSIISLTLQNIGDAFKYLQTAMRQQANNPNVMHQMGVILFTTGKYNEALEYLQKAVALKKYDASTYLYIGLCYEEMGRLQEAVDYYKQALLKDPSNQDINSALDRIKGKLTKQNEQWKMPEQKNQMDVEHGEDILLPIYKSAIDVRLKDENLQKEDEKKENK
jgi:tetratricopeptide (TPR) repeat protein